MEMVWVAEEDDFGSNILGGLEGNKMKNEKAKEEV